MSTNGDFSLVPESEMQIIQAEINKCKMKYESVISDQKVLAEARDSNLHFAKEFDQRSAAMKVALQTEQERQEEALEMEKRKITAYLEEQSRLKTEIQNMQHDIQQMEGEQPLPETAIRVPEKKVVFKGQTSDGHNSSAFDIKPRIVYPMEGGTTLITFEEESVAQNILKLKNHKVQLDGNITINVQASPVHLLVPSFVELDTKVCPHRVLVSNLPAMSEERLLDKLELHFSKKRNGGGEVGETDMLHDSGNVVITFIENNIAKGLTDKQDHEVELEKAKKHKVKVTPFLNGKIANLQTCQRECRRSVLLTGIPAIMEQDTLQDLLEIHFQKTSNGGGEVDNIVYNPLGEHTQALFDEDSSTEARSP